MRCIPATQLHTYSQMQQRPRIAYGIGTAWYKSAPGEVNRDLVDAIKLAVSVGYNSIDAAQVYNNETECGIALKELNTSRDKLWITTKLNGFPTCLDPVKALKESLTKLQLEHVDLYLIHFPFWDGKEGATLEKCWQGMELCKEQGLT